METDIRVPFLDLITPHVKLEDELVAVFRAALRSAGFIGGPEVEGFEHDFAEFCGTEYCVGVGSGTDALRFALMAAGIGRGDTVLTVPNTFIATTEAITQAGGIPDFVDVDELTSNLDPERLAKYIQTNCSWDGKTGRPVSRKTGTPVAAIVPVHLYGQPAHMDSILELAAKYRIMVIEDSCQAHGAEYYSQASKCWKKAGSMGLAAAFSFYPGKNLGCCGEAGAVTTNDRVIAEKVRMLRDHGQTEKYMHQIEGYNGRLDTIQAAILRVKLAYLDGWNAERNACARVYDEMLCDVDHVVAPYLARYAKSAYHLYVIRTDDRDHLQQYLKTNNIISGLHYPKPLHLQEAYRSLGCREGDYPIAERLARQVLSLPMFPGLTKEQQAYVVSKIKEAMGARA
jgi:dTDP-4-amino-4,6-dideoxygalactose transaminase